MVYNKYSVRKYFVSTTLATAFVFSSMLAGGASAHGGPDSDATPNNTSVTEETEEKQVEQTKSVSVSQGNLTKGDRGEAVKEVQKTLPNTKADGIFGVETDEAVKNVQTSNDLAVDGIVGPATKEVLSSTSKTETSESNTETSEKTSENEEVTNSDASEDQTVSNGHMTKGDRGKAVTDLQNSLNNKGQSVSADGVFGGETDRAVKNIQSNNGLTVDGIVGPATKEALSSTTTTDSNTEVEVEVEIEDVTNTENSNDQKEETVPNASVDQSDVVSIANSVVGKPYTPGGTTPAGFDSSGFINYVFDEAGVSLNRTHAGMWANNGTHVDSPSVGDVVFFENTYKNGVSHSGIYLGDNQMAHAGTSQTGVEVTTMGYDYWQDRYIGAKSFN